MCGAALTAADVAWAPFLERYRYQLPALHAGLQPESDSSYPALQRWYAAVDRVPSYACRVAGNASSWRKVLTMAGFGNAGAVPPQIRDNMGALQEAETEAIRSSSNVSDVGDDDKQATELQLWNEYRDQGRRASYLAATPSSEAARILAHNREPILQDTVKRVLDSGIAHMPQTRDAMDAAMRQLVEVLLQLDRGAIGESNNAAVLKALQGNEDLAAVGALSTFLDERMCVPRDMGALSAARIAQIAVLLSSE